MFKEILELLKIEGSLFVLMIISLIFGFETLTAILSLSFLAIPFIYLLYKLIIKELNDREIDKQDNLFKDRQNHFLNIIEKHVPVLYKKKNLSISRNDYGLLDSKWWNKEKADFLSNLKNHYNLYLSNEDYFNLIDYAVDNYNETEKTTTNNILENVPTDPYEYEEYIANFLNDNEWTAKTTQGSGDHGVDVLAIVNRKLVAIQCKLYNSSVGNKAIQEVVTGMKFWEASIPIVVTNSNYTKQAIEIARVHQVYLLHHNDLPNLDIILRNPPVYLS